MLSKLLKHEFRATARIMGPLYLVLLVTAVGANISTRGLLETSNHLLDILGGLLIIAFVIAIIGVCVMSLVLMIRRFQGNLLSDEGYIMFTLPASVHQHIWAKLIVSSVWFIATGVAVCLAAFIMAYDVGLIGIILSGLRDLFHELTAYYALNGGAIILEFLAIMFISCLVACLQFYAAMAVGHSFANHKTLLSVAFFFGSQFLLNFAGGILVVFADATGLDLWLSNATNFMMNGMAGVHFSMLLLMLLEAAYGAIFYGVTAYFLHRRLNLD